MKMCQFCLRKMLLMGNEVIFFIFFFLSQVVLSFSFASGKMSGVGVSSSWWKLDGNTACSCE